MYRPQADVSSLACVAGSPVLRGAAGAQSTPAAKFGVPVGVGKGEPAEKPQYFVCTAAVRSRRRSLVEKLIKLIIMQIRKYYLC